MGRTIIQPIGPLYGEVVNGTVFGRPNGSVYIPETNQISLEIDNEYIMNRSGLGSPPYVMALTNSTGTSWDYFRAIAKAQDIADYIKVEVAPTNEFVAADTAYYVFSAGLFNVSARQINRSYFEIEDGTTYYIRAVLYANSGVAVAASEVKEVTGVVPA